MTDENTRSAGQADIAGLQSISTDAKVIGELSSIDGTGVFGRNKDGSGDPGPLPSGMSTGVYGVTDKSGTTNGEPNAVGVFGNSVASSGQTVGVVGRTESADGIGVIGNDISGDGLAMYASGDLEVEGSVSTRDVGMSAALSSDQSIPNDTQTVVTFDSVVQDDFGAYDPSTGEFTVPAAGDYRVEAGIFWSESFSNDRIDHQIEVNGSIDGGVNVSFDGSDNVARTHTRTLFGLSQGDTITIEVQQRSGSAKDLFGSQIGAETYLSVVKSG